MAAKRPISSPAQNAFLSPESTTRAQSLLVLETIGRIDKRLEHRGIECIHFVAADEANVGYSVGHRNRDTIVHRRAPLVILITALQAKTTLL